MLIMAALLLAWFGGKSAVEWVVLHPREAPPDGVAMRFEEGAEAIYHAEGKIEYAMQRVGSNSSGTLTFSYDVHTRVIEKSLRQAVLAFEIRDLKTHGSVDYIDLSYYTKGGVDSAFVVKVHPLTGDVMDVQGLQPSNSGVRDYLWSLMLMESVRNTFPGLPREGTARVGDSWEKSAPLTTSTPGVQTQAKATWAVKYAENIQAAGVDSARFSVDVDSPVLATITGIGLNSTAMGRMTGESSIELDRRTGWPVAANSASRTRTIQENNSTFSRDGALITTEIGFRMVRK